MNLDIGGDGTSTHSTIPKDAYGYALHYYNGDYKAIGGTAAFADARTAPGYQPLYNGNIAASSLNIAQLGKPLLYVYGYDQLNRLKRQNAFKGLDTVNNIWHPIGMQAYAEKISYDANGNILTYNRHGADTTGMPVAMDSLTYAYNRDANGNITNNRLRHVTDAVPDANSYTADLKSQPTDNYQYDALGNLIKDTQAGIDTINWTVYGKIKSIVKGSSTISYNYNPSGQRISKTANGLTTYYVRDAQGNTLALYDNANNAVNWREQHLYGSNRLGIWTPNVNLANNNALAVWNTAGLKFFELTNHLGNVIETITDRRRQVAKDTSLDHYIADVATAQDYSAFGAVKEGRSFGMPSSRGFNGQERSLEVDPNGNHNTAQFWEYDARIGRRWNIDPKTAETPEQSPYAAFNGNPILYADPAGDSGIATLDKATKTITVTSIYLFYGSKSSPRLAKQSAENIEKAYNNAHGTVKIDGTIYKVKFKVRGIDLTGSKINTEKNIKRWIENEKDARVNWVRLEEKTSGGGNPNSSYTDVRNGGNTGYWNTKQMEENKGTTEPHEANHAYNGLDHPSSTSGNEDQNPSIDMTVLNFKMVKKEFLIEQDGLPVLDVTKRKVTQKNIDAIFNNNVKGDLKDSGKANVGELSNEYHSK